MKRKRLLVKILPFLKNKYFITLFAALIWLLFFDRNDIIKQYQLTKKVNELETEKEYFQREIDKNRADLHELKTNKANLEKFAREKYLMKKDEEDIFVIVEKESNNN